MALLILGLILFIGSHSLPMATRQYAHLKHTYGEEKIKGFLGLFAMAGIAAMVYGYGMARDLSLDHVYSLHGPYTNIIAGLLMLPVFPLFASAYLPGYIKKNTHHPMLLAVSLWSLAHLIVGGEPQAIALFGCFFLWSVIDRISNNKRDKAAGRTEWAKGNVKNDFLAILIGLSIHVLFVVYLHEKLFGVPAM
ncbi:NnrU family protein [Polycladidibacter stylochi]|uniref:NnrU family protein n=1 Tax=Polycladidibacter stylochi TaxID=1807766 RepID=UPI000836A1DA|nr:NnrU family protein [Pseudovibrio stylochi]